jgi:hypothetical protein
MRPINVLSWTTTFPLDKQEHKADWSAYEGEAKDGCLTLHNLSAEDAEKIVRVLHSYEELRTNGDKRQTNFAGVLETEARPTQTPAMGHGGTGGNGATRVVVEVNSRPTLVEGGGGAASSTIEYDMFPQDICETTDFRAVLVHWMRGGVTDRSALLKLAEANRERLVSLAVVKDVRKKFNSVYPSVQAITSEIQ